jgi:hypothetical protein
VEDVQQRIVETRQAKDKKRFDELAAICNEKLNEFINLYFINLTNDEETDKDTFGILNKEWKDIAYKANISNKNIITIHHDALEKNINDILTSEEYQKKLAEKLKAIPVVAIEPIAESIINDQQITAENV